MQGHRIVGIIGPALAMCDRCERVVDVYEWSEPCEAVDTLADTAGHRMEDAAALVAS